MEYSSVVDIGIASYIYFFPKIKVEPWRWSIRWL